ncbi:hypothetical protein BDN72DRAFT_897056 [Pluteus cervinus]|uniref:Uncharacterized protein n=1 Tax=Pluteus cervinus TaxID=181527 RepID=A0ACD3AVA0_9AGAR|nr:hypothetical protein BDN72DRAFT_897056 [Pluteus cervinus]
MQLISRADKFAPAIRDVRNNPCPISTLPVELLQEIFAFSMTIKPSPRIRPSIPLEERNPPVFQATALILTWVCSQWRHIALSLPELWGTMSIYAPKSYCVQLVKLYLSRSGDDTPLNLRLRQNARRDYRAYRDFESCPEHKVTVEIFKLWIAQAHRWRSIFLYMTYTPPSYELPTIPADALCSLEEADLFFRERARDNEVVIGGLWANILRSPALRTAYWHDIHSELPAAPFSQLCEFGPFCPTVDEFLTLLPSCHRLRCLSVDTSKASHNPASTPLESTIILPYLECLNLSIAKNSPNVLEWLTAPVLRELKIRDTRDAAFDEVDSLERFLDHSGCTLRALRLRQERMEDEMPVIKYFSQASHRLVGLESCSLTILDATFSERAISLFTPQVVDNTLLVPFPSLVDLEFYKVVAKDGVLSSMIHSRAAAGAPLWAFDCTVRPRSLNSTGYPKDEEAMQRLLQDGLHLYWDFWDKDDTIL